MNSHSKRQGMTLLRSCQSSHKASIIIISALLISVAGCSGLYTQPKPISSGEAVSGYTYVPIDPTKVGIDPGDCSMTLRDIETKADNSAPKKLKLLDLLPDNAVRLSMEMSDAKGNVTYGVSKVGSTGAAYKLTADYVNSDTVNQSVWVRRTVLVNSKNVHYDDKGKIEKQVEETSRRPISVSQGGAKMLSLNGSSEERVIEGSEGFEVKSFLNPPNREERKGLELDKYEEFNVPIYVGIGLRIVAEGISLSGDANISGIGVVGAEAQANRLLGSLTVQTLGVNSQAVASALPVHSELSRTTAENAFVAIGSIKALLHQQETIKTPRVVGLYLPFPGGKPLVNALISELSRNPVKWCPSGFALANAAHH